ncbi:MAG: hypothetical protein HOV77_18035 [Hamadaea sp.]|nr:hypothetical protein [Hamadaea sp.]
MTDLNSTDPAFPTADTLGSDVLYTVYLTSVDEVLEHVSAADTLGLGFRLESYVLAGEDSELGGTEFEFTLLNHMPARREDS